MKNPTVSIIITTKNSSRTIRNCLNSIVKQDYKNIEIILVDNNSNDSTKEIARSYTSNVFNMGPERSSQRNFGAKKATGKYLFFIDSDMVLSTNVVSECVEKIENKKLIAIVVPEKSFGIGFWSECKKMERESYLNVDWIEAARFFTSNSFFESGGYDLKNTGTEDYDLPQRIEYIYGKDKIGRIHNYIFHDEGNIVLFDLLKKKFYYSKKLAIYSKKRENKNKFYKQSNILLRYYLFLKKIHLIKTKPIIFTFMIIMKTMEFMSGGLGMVYGSIKNEED